ncbi:MAG: hypothetical protein K2J39_00570 [Ruminococcus sp.]|nr:hypothetical protein [Ruminococcus sp.]
MTYKEMTRKYEECGLTDYQLRTLEDLKEIHGVDVRKLSGYSGMSENSRKLFDVTVLRFYNAHGLDSRLQLKPEAVNYVLDITYCRNDETVRREIFLVDSNMRVTKKCLHRYIYKKNVAVRNCTAFKKHYLRFELKGEWYHITGNGQWY